jgi:hypothetical protein
MSAAQSKLLVFIGRNPQLRQGAQLRMQSIAMHQRRVAIDVIEAITTG